ncbi:Hypothetical protein GLP15_328 [Giardia lamblia P15]|uniref:Uncharacterized protein n=1 Tax=Giardia intestinalis (strain P15) TaxID=658858 RepID=E1F3Q9_GIAIA|nr:Hypothetical protein GLP15_328 [Giardia lamblia P15]
MISSSTALSEHSFESDEFFPIKDTINEIILLYTAGDEVAANIKLRELTDNIITASSKSIDELFSYKCLHLIFSFVGDGAHELSLHLLSFLTIFSQNFHKLQEFSSSSTSNLNAFLKPLRHIDNPEILVTYSDFFRDLSFTQNLNLGYTILTHIITSMFSTDSFSKVQNFGAVLKQLLSPHNIQIADFFLKYLNTYLSENYSEIVGYGKLSALELADRLRSLEATLAFPRNEKQSICERLTILDEESAYMEQRSRTPSLAQNLTCAPCPLPQTLQTSWGVVNRTSRSCTPILIVNREPSGDYQRRQLCIDQCLDIHSVPDAATELDYRAMDAFFTAITCLMETLPLGFSLAMNIINMSKESLQQDEQIDLNQDFEDRRFSGSVDSTLSQGSFAFLTNKNELYRKPSDTGSGNRSISPFPTTVSYSKALSPDVFLDKEEPKAQKPMMPPRHTETKRSAESAASTDMRVYETKRLSIDSNSSSTPLIRTPTGENAHPPSLTETELTPIPEHSNRVQENDDQTFQDLFNAHFMPSVVDDEVLFMPTLGQRVSGSDFQCAHVNYNPFQALTHGSESDNPSFQVVTIPNRAAINPSLIDQAQQYLQTIKIFIHRTALLLSDSTVSIFIKLKMLNLLLLLSNEAKEHKYTEYFTIMTESSCYDSIIHLSIKTEQGSVLHSLAYSLLTTAMNTLKTFALNSSMMTAILHKIRLVYDTNLLYTGQKALQCRSFQEFVDYLSVNGLYPLRNRTSLISLCLGLVKYWISTCCGYEFSFSGLFTQTYSIQTSIQEMGPTADSLAARSNNLSGSKPVAYDSAEPEPEALHKSSCYSNNTSMLPNFINFANPNNRCALVPIPGIVDEVSILLMKRFLSVFVLSTRTARYFYHMHPIQYYSTPAGRIVALSTSLRASIPPPPSTSLAASSLAINSHHSGVYPSSGSPKPLVTSVTSTLPHSVVLSSYMQKSINWPGHSTLREEDLADPCSMSGDDELLETNMSRTTSRYTNTDKQSLSQKIVTRYTIEVPQSPIRLSHLTDAHAGTSGISLLESTSLLVASATGSSATRSTVHEVPSSTPAKPSLDLDNFAETPRTSNECETLSDLSDSLIPDIVHQYKDLPMSPAVSIL